MDPLGATTRTSPFWRCSEFQGEGKTRLAQVVHQGATSERPEVVKLASMNTRVWSVGVCIALRASRLPGELELHCHPVPGVGGGG